MNLAASRALVEKVLAGEITPENDPASFDDDVVHFAICDLEDHDPDWLLAAVRDRRHPLAGRRNVVTSMGRLQARLWAELRVEDPTLPPYPFA